jgi:proteasome lid subunit RPN8/RPN11
MVQQARAELPNECCGVLAGRLVPDSQGGPPQGEIMACFPLVNAAASPCAYESDPRSMFAAVRSMRERGLEILAVYHSHPSAAPLPSRTDLARNFSPEVVNLIIGLSSRDPEIRGWWLTDTDYREAVWEVV